MTSRERLQSEDDSLNDSAPADDESTGLPGLRTWPRVYAFVLVSFVLCVALLTLLSRAFS